MKDGKNNSGNFNVWALIAIILYAFVLYFYPLRHVFFCYDDSVAIENNGVIKQIDIPKIFNAFNTRFLPGLSFAFNYQLCHLHPVGYRLINLLIHCLNAFLVYLLIKSTLYLYSAGKSMFFCRLEWPAFFASMLFLCHPIQTEPVNFITQRFVLMGTFFYLLTLFLYIQYRCRKQKRYIIAAMAAAIAAMFCKEFVVTLPLMLILYDFYFLDALAETWWKRCSRVLPFFVIVLIVPVLLSRTPREAIGVANIAGFNLIQEGDSPIVGNHIDITRAHGGMGRREYFLTELNVVCTYVRLLFLPINQNFDYDYPVSHAMNAKTLMSGVFLLCLLILAAATYKSYRIISFSILWFFIALSVESSFIPIADVITEYRLYLASAGFAFLVMMFIYMQPKDRKRLNMMAVVVLMGFSMLTYQRNKVWKDEFTLWNDTVAKSPHKARPYNSLGVIYGKEGNFTQAVFEYTRAIEINPNYAEAYGNRGVSYDKQGKPIEAISDYTKAIEINPNLAYPYVDRGTAYAQQGDFIKAISDLNKAIAINPIFAEAYFNRGIVYGDRNNFSQALSDYTKAIEINPNYADAYNNRGNTYDDQGKMPQAIIDYTKAIAINPQFLEAYDNRGIDYADQGNMPQAISDFTKAIGINPQYAEAYNNRGYAYSKEKEYDKAWADVRKAEGLGYAVNAQFLAELKKASGRDN